MTAAVKSEVVEFPPMSAVRTFLALSTSNVADAIELAVESSLGRNTCQNGRYRSHESASYPKCLNIIVALKIIAAGLALLVPLIS